MCSETRIQPSWALFASPWASPWALFASPGLSLATLGLLLWASLTPFGSPGRPLGRFWSEVGFGVKFGGSKVCFGTTGHLKLAKNIPCPDPPDPGDLVHGLLLGTSPTRAGGQDDVSSNKLPQIISRMCACQM